MYRLKIRKSALKSFRRMPKHDAVRMRGELTKLAEDPHRKDIDIVRLRNREGFRMRTGEWRVIFDRRDEVQEIEILRVGLRRDIYRQ